MQKHRCFLDITNSPRLNEAKPTVRLQLNLVTSTTATPKTFNNQDPTPTVLQKRQSPSKKLGMKRCVRKKPGLSIVINSPTLREASTPSQKQQQASTPSKITDFLFVSGVDVAQNLEAMQSAGITHVINMCGYSAPNYFPSQFQYQRLPIRDHNTVDITPLLLSLIGSIRRTAVNGGVVLVHCVKGISRSTTVAIAYMMWAEQWSLAQAFQHVKSCRPIINPNAGFFFQLNDWSIQLERYRAHCVTQSADASGDKTTAIMFRVQTPELLEGDDYSTIPAIEGPYDCSSEVESTTPEHEDACFVFILKETLIIWHKQYCNPDSLSQTREACVLLQLLNFISPASTAVEYSQGSEPEHIAEHVVGMLQLWKED
jgi:hypothetical protein